MKKPISLGRSLVFLVVILSLVMAGTIYYSYRFENMLLSTLAYLPTGVAGGAMLVILGPLEPKIFRNRCQWRAFLWAAPLISASMGTAGYGIMWWLYGKELPLALELLSWILLIAGAAFGPWMAWHRGKSFKWVGP